jgi:hypothetical protein
MQDRRARKQSRRGSHRVSARAGSARNAVRHGVLAEPDPERVNDCWHILGDTQRWGLTDSPEALTGRELAALALADSEARLDAAHAHYVACQPEGVDPDMRKMSERARGLPLHGRHAGREPSARPSAGYFEWSGLTPGRGPRASGWRCGT